MQTSIQTIRVKFIKPSVFLARLERKPAGIEQILPDDAKMRFTVRGTPDDVAAFAQLVQLADTPPLRFAIVLNLVRYSPSGKRERLLESKTTVLENHQAATVKLGELCLIDITPHSAPNAVKLDAIARVLTDNKSKKYTEAGRLERRTMPPGKPLLLASIVLKGGQTGVLAVEIAAKPAP